MKRLQTILISLFFIFSCGVYFAQDAKDLVRQGKRAQNMGNTEEAIEIYNQAIDLEPDFTDAYTARAYSYGFRGDHDLAIQDYTKVIELDPNNADVYISRGSGYNDMHKFNLALSDFNKAIELDPTNARAYNNRGFTKKGLGDKDGACKDWKKSKKLGNGEAKIILINNQC